MQKKKSPGGLTDALYKSKTASLLEIKREPRHLLEVGTVSSRKVGPVSYKPLYCVKQVPWNASRILKKESTTQCIPHARSRVAAIMQSGGPW